MNFVLALVLNFAVLVSTNPTASPRNGTGKLLYILLDGFRFDYLDDQPAEQIPGFTELIKNGVKAQYMTPLTPSLSYPSWTSLVTGLYAESHTLVGNYMYDAQARDDFSLFNDSSTGKQKWWVAEPIWTTATKAGRRAALHLWSRCDVPFSGVLPEYCDKFQKITGPEIFRTNIDKALDNFGKGFDLVQVYTEHLDNIGHTIGPETEDRKKAVREIDATLVYLQRQLERRGLNDTVNIVIVSDHGMTDTGNATTKRVWLDQYLPQGAPVERIADQGAFINIKVAAGRVDEVYNPLSKIPGVKVYKKNDIPEDFHVAKSKYMHDILIVADLKTFVMSSNRSQQLPPPSSFVYYGAHGYSKNEKDMRAIFFAKGPVFVPGTVLDPINIVDVYQVLAHVLNVEPRPHNGTWSRVERAIAQGNGAPGTATGAFGILPLVLSTMFIVRLNL